MSDDTAKNWEPKFGVPNGGHRPSSAFSPRVGRMVDALRSFASVGAQRLDSWVNDVTGIGTSRDKTTYGYILPSRLLSDEELSALYHSDDMAARMVDVVPQEMLREPFDVETGDPDLDVLIADKVDSLDMRAKLADGIRWARCFGGGALLIGADDRRDALEELKPERASDIGYLYVIDRRYLWPLSYYDEPGHPKLGQVRTYMVTTLGGHTFNTGEVHESRLIVFQGATTGTRERMVNRGWNHSVMQRAYDVLRQFNTGWQSVETMMTDGAQAVFKIGGLTEMLAANGGREMLATRMRAMDLYRSVVRAIVIDADAKEEFERQQVSFSEIPQTLDKFMLRLAASVEMPVTILMGQSPSGMNATGESDFRWFYDRIRAQQNTMLAPKIRHLINIWLRTKAGQEASRGKEPETLKVKFVPLWTETPLAQAQREKTVAETDTINITSQVFTPEEVANVRGRAGGYEGPIVLSDESIEIRERALEGQAKVEELLPADADKEVTKLLDDGTEAPAPELDEEGMPIENTAEPEGKIEINLTPTDVAVITKVNEARKASGLAPLPEPDGSMFLPAFKAKYASVLADAALAEQGQDPDAPAPKPSFGGGFGGPPKFGAPKPPPIAGPKGGSQSALARVSDKDTPEGKEPEKRPGLFAHLDAKPRTFTLVRDEDESGVSGTGDVATGCLFDDGRVALRWRTKTASTTLFDSMEHVLSVHGHGGLTRVVWD
jgi:phage-related protein (TIGR01555 family)